MSLWGGVALLLAAAGAATMVWWTSKEVRRLRRIREAAEKTTDPGRLAHLRWLIDHPGFEIPWRDRS